MHRSCYIIEGDPSPEDDATLTALEAVSDALSRQGLVFHIETDESFPDGSAYIIWEEREERATFQAIFEAELKLCYIVITSARKTHLKQIQDVLTQHVPLVPIEELMERARRGLMWDSRWLVKVGIVAGDRPDTATFELLRDGLAHRNPNTRYHASLAAAHGRWPELIPDLERVLKGEPDERVQDMAQRALDLALART